MSNLTEKPVQGVQGIQGIQGIMGDGYMGPAGPRGIQGTQGTIGLKGPKGDDGLMGTQGIQGLQGTSGSMRVTLSWTLLVSLFQAHGISIGNRYISTKNISAGSITARTVSADEFIDTGDSSSSSDPG